MKGHSILVSVEIVSQPVHSFSHQTQFLGVVHQRHPESFAFAYPEPSGEFVNVVSGNSIARIGYDGSTTSGGVGIEMSGHDNLVVGNNINHLYDGSVRRAYAVCVNACNSDLIVGNTIYENPVNSGIGYCVYLTGSDDNVVRGNLMVGTASQTCYGVYVADSACDNTVVESNAFLANLSAKITNNGTGTKIKRNIGYPTENSGTATILSGQSSVQFAHGLAAVPWWLRWVRSMRKRLTRSGVLTQRT